MAKVMIKMKKSRQYVIVGGGIASVGCIEGIRAHDHTGKIILVSGEGRPVYCRPLISYYLEGKTDFEKMKYRPDSFYEEYGCEIVNAKATEIDPAAHTVSLDNGKSLSYDSLLIATGSSPFVPPFKGLDTVPRKFGFMTEDDALALSDAIDSSTRVFIVGAGLIGLKCAEGICERVAHVTICDLADRVLSSILDENCAPIMQKQLEDHGISFLLGDSADSFSGNTAYMKSGKEVPFDVLVLAVGVRANISLVKDAGGQCDRGILTDTAMKTSLDDVFAAGDCAQGYDASVGKNRVLAILPNAYMQGNCAGKNMAGGDELFDNAFPMNAIGFFGLHALTAGSYAGDVYEEKTEHSIKRLFTKDNRLIGFILLGDCVDRAGIYTALIRDKTPLDTIGFEKIKKSPSLIGFSYETRRKKLGGVI